MLNNIQCNQANTSPKSLLSAHKRGLLRSLALRAQKIAGQKPDLTAYGFMPPGVAKPDWASTFLLERTRLLDPENAPQFEGALAFLLFSDYIDDEWQGDDSYGLKHWAEHWAYGKGILPSGYVSNGAMIAAALALDLTVIPDKTPPNAFIRPKQLQPTGRGAKKVYSYAQH